MGRLFYVLKTHAYRITLHKIISPEIKSSVNTVDSARKVGHFVQCQKRKYLDKIYKINTQLNDFLTFSLTSAWVTLGCYPCVAGCLGLSLRSHQISCWIQSAAKKYCSTSSHFLPTLRQSSLHSADIVHKRQIPCCLPSLLEFPSFILPSSLEIFCLHHQRVWKAYFWCPCELYHQICGSQVFWTLRKAWKVCPSTIYFSAHQLFFAEQVFRRP